jgi:hypothetical protein
MEASWLVEIGEKFEPEFDAHLGLLKRERKQP